MFEDHNDSIYDILKSAPNIDSALLMELTETFIQTGKSLANSAIDGDLLKREELLEMSEPILIANSIIIYLNMFQRNWLKY